MLRLIILLVVFVPLTIWGTYLSLVDRYWGFLDVFHAGGWSTQVFCDFGISLFIVVGFMRADAIKRGLPWIPYALATPFLGSVPPLAYLIHREWRRLQEAKAAG
jgi:hypothetical protein